MTYKHQTAPVAKLSFFGQRARPIVYALSYPASCLRKEAIFFRCWCRDGELFKRSYSWKYEGDITSMVVTRDYTATTYNTLSALTARQENCCGVGGKWWRLVLMRPQLQWTPWSPFSGNLQEATASLHALGQQRSLSTMSVQCRTKCQRVLQLSRLELLPAESFRGANTVACLQPCTAIQRQCQGHPGCTRGDGLLCWWV